MSLGNVGEGIVCGEVLVGVHVQVQVQGWFLPPNTTTATPRPLHMLTLSLSCLCVFLCCLNWNRLTPQRRGIQIRQQRGMLSFHMTPPISSLSLSPYVILAYTLSYNFFFFIVKWFFFFFLAGVYSYGLHCLYNPNILISRLFHLKYFLFN